MSYFASMYVRIVTRMPLRDATAGFVCYSRHALETIDLDAVKMKGYGFQIEMKYSAWRLGLKLKEVSIHFRRTPRGHLEDERRHFPRSVLRRAGTSVSFDQEREKPVTAIRQKYGSRPPREAGFHANWRYRGATTLRESEREEIVHEEVPEGDDPDGKQFSQVEIQLPAFMQQIDREVVDQ